MRTLKPQWLPKVKKRNSCDVKIGTSVLSLPGATSNARSWALCVRKGVLSPESTWGPGQGLSPTTSLYQQVHIRDIETWALIPPTADQGLKPLQTPLVHDEHEANEETKPH